MVETDLALRIQMANQLFQAGQADKAEPLFRQILAKDPGNAQATLPLVELCKRRRLNSEAVELVDAMRRLNAEDPAVQRHVAVLLAGLGRFDLARSAWLRVRDLQPDDTDCFLRMALITDFTAPDEMREMELLFARDDLSDRQRRPLAYALGKACDDLREYDRAFEYFLAGNEIARRSNRYSIDREAADYQRIQAAFPPDFFRRYSGSGIEDNGAIFVIGMARSGTTLVERILARHERVHGGGELTAFTELIDRIGAEVGAPFPFAGVNLDATLLQGAARRYISIIKNMSANSDYVTNKNVANNVYFGMARVMMPNAKFIFVDRDPRDQSLSFFQKDFGKNLPYYYSLEELGRRFHFNRRLEEHWRCVLPDSSLTIQYEDLVANPEALIRGLLEFCGLSFDPACLSFHESDDAVSTMSLTQVRRPLNSDSIGRWKNYQDHLKPLLDSLERHASASDR
jgi:tetratricopeptide (TPR) repeat protein